MHLKGNEKLYLWHELLRHLGMFVFYSFGALLFFEITGSISSVFILGGAYFALGSIPRSILVPFFLKIKSKIGVVNVMGIGLGVVAVVNTLIFFFSKAGYSSLPLLILLLFIASLGTGMYWLFSNIIKLSNIGGALHPASYSSFLVIVRLFSATAATILGIFLSFQDHFLFLLVLSSIILFLSLIPLTKMEGINHKENFKLKNIFSHISPLGIWSNIRMVPEFFNYAFPLFFLISFVSLPKSVLITGVSYIISATVSYYVGHLVDHKNNKLTVVCSVLVVLGFLLFTQVNSVKLFVIILATLGVCIKAIKVASNARLGKEIVASPNKIEFMSGIEIAREIGSSAALFLFLALFLMFGELPQWMFGLGALFIIPEALYACGYKLKKAK